MGQNQNTNVEGVGLYGVVRLNAVGTLQTAKTFTCENSAGYVFVKGFSACVATTDSIFQLVI